MQLKAFIRKVPPDDREDFAKRCGTTLKFLRQVAYGAKTPSAELCIGIARETGGDVPVRELRPDLDWHCVAADSVASECSS